MSIDKLASSLLAALVRIAVSLEALVESQGIVAGTIPPKPHVEQQELALDDDDDDLSDLDDPDDDDGLGDDDLDDDPAPSRKKGKKKKKAGTKKKSAKKKRIGKPAPEETSDYTEDEVRNQLKEVQLATGKSNQSKSILKENGASTFGQLKVGRYNAVVLACEKILDEYE